MYKLKTVCLSVLVFFTFSNIELFAQSTIAQAQAVFIYNFTKMVEWPLPYQKGDFIIGVCGNSDVFPLLQSYCKNKKVGNQQIKIINFFEASTITNCQILFITFGKTRDFSEIENRIAGNSTLLITEKTNALQNGSAINFVVSEDKLKFEIKELNATKYNLKLLSTLKTLAIPKH